MEAAGRIQAVRVNLPPGLGRALVGRKRLCGLGLVERNLEPPWEKPRVAPRVAHVVRQFDELQAPAPRPEHLDGKDHERSHADLVVGYQKSSARIHLD